MPAGKDARFGISSHIEGFSTVCGTACNQPGLTDTVKQACDVGSQAYCTQAANITSPECNDYLTRVIGTSAAVRLTRDYSNKIKPATSATVADYYNALGDSINMYMQSNVNNLSTARITTLMNIINSEETGGTMGSKIADGVLTKLADGSTITNYTWLKNRVIATVRENATAWAGLTASAILTNIQANFTHYQKYHTYYNEIHDLLETKLTLTDLNNSTLAEMRKLSPAVKNLLVLFVIKSIINAPAQYDSATGTIQSNLANKPALYNANIQAFLTAIKPAAFTERYANCTADWTASIEPMTTALLGNSGLSAADQTTIKNMAYNYCMSSSSTSSYTVSSRVDTLIRDFKLSTTAISGDGNRANVLSAYNTTAKYYSSESWRNTAITIINNQVKAFDAATTKTCNGFSDTKLDLLMRTTNKYYFDSAWAAADTGALAPAGTYVTLTPTTMSTNALYAATKAAYNATTQFYATTADRANAVAITGTQANTFSFTTVGNQKVFSDTKLNTLMLTTTKAAFTTAWNAADVGPFKDISPTTMMLDANYAALMSDYKADVGFGSRWTNHPYVVVENQRLQFNLSTALSSSAPYQKFYAAMLTTTKAEFAAVLATPDASFTQTAATPTAPSAATPLMISLIESVKQADAFNRALWPYVDTVTNPVAIAMTAAGDGPPATPPIVTTDTINATMIAQPTMDKKLIYARALKLALKADMTYDKTILAAVNGFYEWLKDAMADVTTNGVTSSKCGTDGGPTIEECTKLCGIFPEFCESDQAKRCQDPAYRYQSKEGFEIGGGESPIWWLIAILSFIAVIFAAVVAIKYINRGGSSGNCNSSATVYLGAPLAKP